MQRNKLDDGDYRCISGYFGKWTSLELISLNPFNSELFSQKNQMISSHHHLPRTAAKQAKALTPVL